MNVTRRRSAGAGLIVAIVLVVVVAVGLGLWWVFGGSVGSSDSELTVAVKRGPLTISVTEPGVIKSRDRVVLRCEVEGWGLKIMWIVEEGKQVEKGELLVELDASKLLESKEQQESNVLSAKAGHVQADENLKITTSQGESDVSKAELAYEFAKQDLEKYTAGEYPKELKAAENKIILAKEDLRRAQEKAGLSKELYDLKFITKTDLETDELAVKRQTLNLELAKLEQDLLTTYSHQRKLKQLESDVTQNKMALERATRKAKANLNQAGATLASRKQSLKQQEKALVRVTENIKKCKMYAPVSGMVIYATTSRRRYGRQPLEKGQEVHRRQELIHLPTSTSMMAEVKIHESSLRKVKEGMPAYITVDSLPGKIFPGKVTKIALMADQQRAWLNPDLKVYPTEVYMEGTAGHEIRPGLGCKAEIIVEQHKDVLYVPVQTVVRVSGQPTVYLPSSDRDKPIPRKVEIGLDNNKMVHIISGLKKGEMILMAPPLAESKVPEKPEIEEELEIPEPEPRQPDAGREGGRNGEGGRGRTGGRMRGQGASGRQRPESGGTGGGRRPRRGNRGRRPSTSQGDDSSKTGETPEVKKPATESKTGETPEVKKPAAESKTGETPGVKKPATESKTP